MKNGKKGLFWKWDIFNPWTGCRQLSHLKRGIIFNFRNMLKKIQNLPCLNTMMLTIKCTKENGQLCNSVKSLTISKKAVFTAIKASETKKRGTFWQLIRKSNIRNGKTGKFWQLIRKLQTIINTIPIKRKLNNSSRKGKTW